MYLFLFGYLNTTYLAFTRYSFTSRFLCTNQSSLYPPPPLALPTPLQYYCTDIAQNTTLPPTPVLFKPYTIQYWRLQYLVKANSVHKLSTQRTGAFVPRQVEECGQVCAGEVGPGQPDCQGGCQGGCQDSLHATRPRQGMYRNVVLGQR